MKYTFENVAPWFFNKKQEWFLTIIHCKSADIFPVQTKQNNYLLVNLIERSMECSTMYTINSSNLQINSPYFALSLNITNLFLYIPVIILHIQGRTFLQKSH